MLNKEMLLGGGRRGIIDAPYTHTVIVGAYDNKPSNAIGFAINNYGDLTPTSLYGSLVRSLLVDKFRHFTQLQLLDAGTTMNFYVARADRELVLRPDQSEFTNIDSYAKWDNLIFFTEDDVGKSIPIWISRDPPPYG